MGTTADIESAKFRNQDHDCTLNRKIISAAQGYQKNPDPLMVEAAQVLLRDYDPNEKPAQKRVYYAPHIPGKPEAFSVEYEYSHR